MLILASRLCSAFSRLLIHKYSKWREVIGMCNWYVLVLLYYVALSTMCCHREPHPHPNVMQMIQWFKCSVTFTDRKYKISLRSRGHSWQWFNTVAIICSCDIVYSFSNCTGMCIHFILWLTHSFSCSCPPPITCFLYLFVHAFALSLVSFFFFFLSPPAPLFLPGCRMSRDSLAVLSIAGANSA